jgi:transposase
MSKRFRSWDVDQQWLLPPSIHDFVPEGHAAHFVRELVREDLELGAILGGYEEERGQPPYHPAMMTAVLLYAYTQGVYSSRRIARACEERVDFMAVTAMQRPDFRTVSDFRKRHLEALGGLFMQVLDLCGEAGLVKLGHVALDGTKIRANASKHKGMSYGRMKKAEKRLKAQVREWFERAEAADAEEDERYGSDRRGDELPDWVADKQKRLEKIREAKEALEKKAQERDAEAIRKRKDKRAKGKRSRGRPPKRKMGEPEDKEQRNFTDPDSRIMKTPDGFQQCFNAQAAVDASSQVIVGQSLTQSATDRGQLIPLVDAVRKATSKDPKEISADCDYCTEANLEELEARGIRGYVATGKQQHGQPDPVEDRKTTAGTRTHAMKIRIRRGGYRSRYRLRKQTVEPVFGQIKAPRGFRQFLLRGFNKVSKEWALVCTAHNILKLAAVSSA